MTVEKGLGAGFWGFMGGGVARMSYTSRNRKARHGEKKSRIASFQSVESSNKARRWGVGNE